MASKSLSDQQIKEICEKYKAGSTSTLLGKEYDVNDETIRKWLKRSGIQMRKSRDSLAASVNRNFFSIIDTEHKAYWLGFLIADGCINKSNGVRRRLRFYLAKKDEDMIKQFAKDIDYKGKLRLSEKFPGITFSDPIFCGHLIRLGYLDWKKGNPRILDSIPDNFMHHFIRGFFDGNGYIAMLKNKSKSKMFYVHFCTDKRHTKCLEAIKNIICDQANVSKRGLKIRQTACEIKWNGNLQISRIGNWLYKDATRKMNRKYIRFQLVSNRSVLSNWVNIHEWDCFLSPKDLKDNKDINTIIDQFTDLVITSWEPPSFDKIDLLLILKKLKELNVAKYIGAKFVKSGKSYGNKIIQHFQPSIWAVGQNNSASMANLAAKPKICQRAVKSLLTSGNRIYPSRLARELQFAGLTHASILSVSMIMTIIQKFNLSGSWFDPCAGWGTRLIVAHILKLDYEATDPASHFDGLIKIRSFLQSDAKLHNKKFQDINFPKTDFIFTSPPFYDKEDYGLGVMLETFEEWYQSFIISLIEKSKSCKRLVLHLDTRIKDRLSKDFKISPIKYLTGNRCKAPNEWFVEIYD